MIAATAAIPSEIGPAKRIPSIPKIIGKIRIKGIRNKICLVNDKKRPFFALPMEVKKVAVSGCRQLAQVQHKKMLTELTAN